MRQIEKEESTSSTRSFIVLTGQDGHTGWMRLKYFIMGAIGMTLLAVGAYWGFRSLPPQGKLAGGKTITLIDVVSGPYADPQLPGKWRRDLAKKLPPYLAQFMGAGTFGTGGGRSWHLIPEDNAVHFWFTAREGRKVVPLSDTELESFIVSDQGWLFEDFGNGDKASGLYSFNDCSAFSFNQLPRWQDELTLLFRTQSPREWQGQITLPNPHVNRDPEPWLPLPLPQTTQSANVKFTLTRLKSTSHWSWRRNPDADHRMPPRYLPSFKSWEPPGQSNLWHNVKTLWADNFLNRHSSSLPPHGGEGDPSPRTVWKLTAEFCADERSNLATNAFIRIPDLTVPEPGNSVAINHHHDFQGIQLTLISLTGSGTAQYTNGVLAKLDPPYPGISDFSHSSSRSNDGNGRRRYTDEITTSIPHLALQLTGKKRWPRFTVKAVRRKSGEAKYLAQYAAPSPKIRFHNIYESPQLSFMRLTDFEPGEILDLVVGLHLPLTAEFVFEQPVWQDTKKP